MCVAIILLHGQISKNSQLWEIILPIPPLTLQQPGIDHSDVLALRVDRLVAIDLFSY